ncbi:MAG: tRNA (cytidine(34)-2'-O)-methyltransferase [Gemmatimonadota bacterium]
MPSLSLALYEPEIPGNAGNIARLCAATGTPLHLIGRLGFSFRHPDAKRAGMDYWENVETHRHINYDDFASAMTGRRVWALSTHGSSSLWDVEFRADDALLLGPESRGLPADLRDALDPCVLRIPMIPGARSLNLGSSAAVALYEALRQTRERPPY